MSTMELEAYKTELIREILDISSAEVLIKIKGALQDWKAMSANESMPCCYSEEEIKQRGIDALNRYENGEFLLKQK